MALQAENPQCPFRKVIYQYIRRTLAEIKNKWLNYISNLLQAEAEPAREAVGYAREADGVDEARRPSGNIALRRFVHVLSSLSVLIGLGQLWRFPVLAYRLGGGAFVLAYALISLTVGYGVYFFELVLGRVSGANVARVLGKVPVLHGIGLSILVYSFLFVTYYSQMVAYGAFYFMSSFSNELPWSECPAGSGHDCVAFPEEGITSVECSSGNVAFNYSLFCRDDEYEEEVTADCCLLDFDCDGFQRERICWKPQFPSVYFWRHAVARDYDGSDPDYGTLGEFNLSLLVSCLVAWMLVYLFLGLGIGWSGSMMIFTVPIVVGSLVFMLVVALCQKGGGSGLLHLFVPRADSWSNHHLWAAASEQSLYSLGIAMGPVIALGSRRDPSRSLYIDPVFSCLGVVIVSILSACVVFSTIGYLSAATGLPFFATLDASPGLSIIAYSSVLTATPFPNALSIAFFSGFVLLGVTSEVGLVDVISATLPKKGNRSLFVANFLVISFAFLFGLPMLMRGGILIFQVLDSLPGGLGLTTLCVLEVLSVVHLYGIGRFCEDAALVSGFRPNAFIRYVWFLIPYFLIIVNIVSLSFLALPDWTTWAVALGWTAFAVIFLPVPVAFLVVAFCPARKVRDATRRREGESPPPAEEVPSKTSTDTSSTP